jgi:hypothetical protein
VPAGSQPTGRDLVVPLPKRPGIQPFPGHNGRDSALSMPGIRPFPGQNGWDSTLSQPERPDHGQLAGIRPFLAWEGPEWVAGGGREREDREEAERKKKTNKQINKK